MANNKNSPGFHHVAIKVKDFDKTLALYADGFGFATAFAWGEGDGRGAMLDLGDGNYLEVFAGRKEDAAADGALMHFAWRTPDTDAAFARAVAAGFTPTVEPKDVIIPSTPPIHVRLAFCSGPDGEIIEFFQNDVS